ncbi:MAG: iron-containing redox enzyme family protein [Gammaproteobacteria bacterium]|nr:iron-containing redox enzyme family protein [Gammaproteobacteria bacterium]
MPFFNTLMNATEADRSELFQIPQLQAGARGEISLETYIAFLTEAYHHVKHTVPLLMACGSRLPQNPRWMLDAITEYIDEEKGHEEWILNDIAACCAHSNSATDAEAVRHGQPRPATELMVAYAYYTIERINPVAFFGMVLVLEGTSIELATKAADAIQKDLSLPNTAFSYLTSHGALDIEHMSFYEGLMNKIDDEQTQQQIIHCARMMYRLYGDIFRSLPIDNGASS